MSEKNLLDKMSLVDIQYIENANYTKMGGKLGYIVDFTWKKGLVAAMAVIVLLGGSSAYCYANDISVVDYFRKQPLFSWFFHNDVPEVVEQVTDGIAFEGNQEIAYGKFKIYFVNYFAEETTGNVLATFLVTDEQGNSLSDSLFEEFDDLLQNQLDISSNIEWNASVNTSVCRNQQNNAIVTCRMIEETRRADEKIDALQFYERGIGKGRVLVGTFQVPQNVTELKSVELDVSQSILKRVTISGMTMQMTYDYAYAADSSRYSVYERELALVMKDGTKHVLWSQDGTKDEKFIADSFGIGDYENGLADEVFGFAELIDVNEIDYLQMDDEIIKVKETK